jgi:hypothetical protein
VVIHMLNLSHRAINLGHRVGDDRQVSATKDLRHRGRFDALGAAAADISFGMR